MFLVFFSSSEMDKELIFTRMSPHFSNFYSNVSVFEIYFLIFLKSFLSSFKMQLLELAEARFLFDHLPFIYVLFSYYLSIVAHLEIIEV